MLEIQVVLFVLNLFVTCDLSKRFHTMEVEFRYGTYPGDVFPDDPRNKPDDKWWDICKFGGLPEPGIIYDTE